MLLLSMQDTLYGTGEPDLEIRCMYITPLPFDEYTCCVAGPYLMHASDVHMSVGAVLHTAKWSAL